MWSVEVKRGMLEHMPNAMLSDGFSSSEALGMGLAFALAVALYGTGGITLGTAFLVYFYTQALFQPLHMIANQLDDFPKASAAATRAQELPCTRYARTAGPRDGCADMVTRPNAGSARRDDQVSQAGGDGLSQIGEAVGQGCC